MADTPPINKYLILDTNIFSRLSDDGEVGKKIVDYLNSLINRSPGWGLAISGFTLFETLNEIPHKEELKIAGRLATFPFYDVDKVQLYTAAHLGCLYVEHFKELKISDKLPEAGDKIIAATAYNGDGLICTINMRDFPAPFFKEYMRETFTQETNRKGIAHTTIYILETQKELIDKLYQKRTKSNKEIVINKKKVVKKVKKVLKKK